MNCKKEHKWLKWLHLKKKKTGSFTTFSLSFLSLIKSAAVTSGWILLIPSKRMSITPDKSTLKAEEEEEELIDCSD